MTGTSAAVGTYGKSGWYLVKSLGFIVGSIVFSYIFWKTKQCLDNCSPKKKRRK